MDGAVSGHCDQEFGRVATVLRASFARGEETGAAVCVYSGDRLVADLWVAGLTPGRAGRGSRTPRAWPIRVPRP